jgi:hypothetical protein
VNASEASHTRLDNAVHEFLEELDNDDDENN